MSKIDIAVLRKERTDALSERNRIHDSREEARQDVDRLRRLCLDTDNDHHRALNDCMRIEEIIYEIDDPAMETEAAMAAHDELEAAQVRLSRIEERSDNYVQALREAESIVSQLDKEASQASRRFGDADQRVRQARRRQRHN